VEGLPVSDVLSLLYAGCLDYHSLCCAFHSLTFGQSPVSLTSLHWFHLAPD